MKQETDILKYNSAVSEIKLAILNSQAKAIAGVNAEQLSLYMAIGKYISANTRNGVWGTGALKYISERLKAEMPGLRGFSERNLKYMRTFYEEWYLQAANEVVELTNIQHVPNSAVATAELHKTSDRPRENSKTLLLDTSFFENIDLEFRTSFLSVPFTQHCVILTKCENFEQRKFYITLTAREHLSVDALKKALANDEYHHRGTLPNNFLQRLTPEETASRAVLAFKDEYILDFINVEELGVRDIEEIDERVVEQQIVQNIKNFILTFGRDFAFMGNQYRIDAFGKAHFIDLLFFNRELSCMVAVELKTGPFKQAYLGQLNGYLALLDDFVKKSYENPSIGIVLCKDMDNSYVEYMVRQYEKPMGVATYKTRADMPERLRNALPDIEDLKKLL